jgi:long-chain-fatty-acid--CoA ligase ACSBG
MITSYYTCSAPLKRFERKDVYSMTEKKVLIREADDFRVIDPRKAVKVIENLNEEAEFKIDPVTVVDLFEKTVGNYPERFAMIVKDDVTNNWSGISWKEYKSRVEKVAKVFIKLGLERYGTVGVLAFNCVEWFVSELAAIHAG